MQKICESDKGCRQISLIGGKLIKWSGINRPLVLLTFPTETSSASRTSRAPNRQTLWRTLASNHLLPQLVISQSQDRDQIHCGHSRFQVCPLSLSHSRIKALFCNQNTIFLCFFCKLLFPANILMDRNTLKVLVN